MRRGEARAPSCHGGARLEAAVLRALRWLLGIGAATYLAVYVILAGLRMGYPFTLEWLEGGIAIQVQRIVNGQPVYVFPSVTFIPFLYAPLYFYVSALATKLIGGGFLALRLVSFAASLGSFAVIYLIVVRETKERFLGLLTAGLFAATFRMTGAWFDLARVDSLFLLLFLLFVYTVRGEPSKRAHLLAGLFWGLAFLTKQIALVAGAPVLLYCARRNLRYTLFLLVGSAFLLAATVTVALTIASHGWYTYYVFELLGEQVAWAWPLVVSFWQRDLFGQLMPALLAAIYYLLVTLYRDRSAFGAWSLLFLGALAASLSSKVKPGGYDNVLMPVVAMLVILLGLGLHQLLVVLRAQDESRRGAALLWVHVALVCQFCLLYYSPSAQLPTAADRQAGWKLVSYVARVKGNVYLPYHGYLAAMAGKESFANQDAIWDVMRGRQPNVAKGILQGSLGEAIERQKFAVMILDSDWHYFPNLQRYYEWKGTWFASDEDEVFMPVTGLRTRPLNVWVPKQVPVEQAPRTD